MKDLIKNICVAIVGGSLLVWISDFLKSAFLYKFLDDNLLMLLIALLAINITNISLLIAKLEMIPGRFSGTMKQMKWSVFEQVCIILLGLIAQILSSSAELMAWGHYSDIKFFLHAIPATILIFSIIILWDTAEAIFMVSSKQ